MNVISDILPRLQLTIDLRMVSRRLCRRLFLMQQRRERLSIEVGVFLVNEQVDANAEAVDQVVIDWNRCLATLPAKTYPTVFHSGPRRYTLLMVYLGRRSFLTLPGRLTLSCTQTSPMSRIRHSRPSLVGYSSFVRFHFMTTMRYDVGYDWPKSRYPPLQLVCSHLWPIHPICPGNIQRAGRHIIATSCCCFASKA